MNFEIISHIGVGPLHFGMSLENIRTLIDRPLESFLRTPQSSHPCDYFPDLELFVYYTPEGKAEAFEFFEPADPHWNGHRLLKIGWNELISIFSKYDPEISIETDGFTSFNKGIGCYAPDALEDRAALPESIIVFRQGYYE